MVGWSFVDAKSAKNFSVNFSLKFKGIFLNKLLLLGKFRIIDVLFV